MGCARGPGRGSWRSRCRHAFARRSHRCRSGCARRSRFVGWLTSSGSQGRSRRRSPALTLVDAYGLVAFVANEAAASDVEELLRGGECRVVAVNLAEAIDFCARRHDYSLEQIRDALEPLILGGALSVVVSDEDEAWAAAEIRIAHYHRTRCPLSMADCLLLAHALSEGDALATSDPHVTDVARSAGAKVIALPDRSGARPE